MYVAYVYMYPFIFKEPLKNLARAFNIINEHNSESYKSYHYY